MDKKITVGGMFKEGIAIGLPNALAIIVNGILWILTIWIPYLNVGTTIGMTVGLVSKASKGESIGMTEIFNPVYRKRMGEFFLCSGLIGMGVLFAVPFLVIPAYVIGISWSQALLLVVDKDKNPVDAIDLSGKCTYGSKATMFWGYILIVLAFGIVAGILSLLGNFGILLIVILELVLMFMLVGIQAYVYKNLCGDVA